MSMFKVVLVGCGGISNAWLKPALEFDDIEFVGLVDLNQKNAESLNEKYNLNVKAGIDLEKMLDEAKPDIVFDCTVPSAHCGVTVTALEHGCHVLGEKPMAESMDDARRMLAAAENSGKTYAVIQNRRYQKEIVAYRNLLQSGLLGEVTTLNADFYIGAHFDGFRAEMDHVLLVDMAIHSFDQARFICGKEPISVYCHEWNPKGSWYSHGASAMCIFEMSDGVVFNYRGSWCPEGMNTSWECSWRAVCENGSALWDGAQKIEAEMVDGDKGSIFPQKKVECSIEDIAFSRHAGVIREFLDSLKTGKKPQTICSDNIKSLSMVLSAVESAEKGVKVALR